MFTRKPKLKEPDIQRQELACTNCSRYVQFNMDFALDGNHEIACPNCSHIHYRVVKGGLITEERWRSSAGATYYASMITSTVGSYLTFAATGTTSTTAAYTSDLWLSLAGGS